MLNPACQFNRAAKTYNDYSTIQKKSAHILLNKALKFKVENTIEIGAGSGYCTKFLLGAHQKVLAIDIANTLLETIPAHPNLEKICINFEAIENEKIAQADALFSNFALHWCSLSDVKRKLAACKSGCYVNFAIPVIGSLSELKVQYSKIPWMAFDSIPNWQAIFLDWQLEIDQIKLSQSFDNFRSLMHSLKAAGGRQVAARAVDFKTYRSYLLQQKPVSLDYEVVFIHGIKL